MVQAALFRYKVKTNWFRYEDRTDRNSESTLRIIMRLVRKVHTKFSKIELSWLSSYYRPQRSCGKVMFLHLSVSHSVHRERGSLSGRPPPTETPQTETPWTETPRIETSPSPERPPERDPP